MLRPFSSGDYHTENSSMQQYYQKDVIIITITINNLFTQNRLQYIKQYTGLLQIVKIQPHPVLDNQQDARKCSLSIYDTDKINTEVLQMFDVTELQGV